MEKQNDTSDLTVIKNELASHSYADEYTNIEKLFSKMSLVDYVSFWLIEKLSDESESDQKIYLQDMADAFNIPVEKASKLIKVLIERGLVVQQHDGKGEMGTYIRLTKRGTESAKEQESRLGDYYARVIDRFGKEKFHQLISLAAEFEATLNQEANRLKTDGKEQP